MRPCVLIDLNVQGKEKGEREEKKKVHCRRRNCKWATIIWREIIIQEWTEGYREDKTRTRQ